MADYKVFLYDTMTQSVYAEVPFSSLSYDYTMDEAGSATVELPIAAPKRDGNPLTPEDVRPIRTGIVIQRGTELVWGGLVWAYRLNLTTRTIALSAQGYLSYYRYRHTAVKGVKYKDLEQTTMIKNFIASITDGIKTDTSGIVATNMVRTRAWNPYEFKALDEVFADLADDITSFDAVSGKYGGGFFFYLEPYWITAGTKVGNRIRNTANRHPVDSGKSLQQAVNCEFSDIGVDGTGMATTAFAVGATDGTSSLTPFASDDNPALLAEIPHVNAILTENGIKEARALQYKVRSALSFGSTPVILPTANTYPGLFSPLELQPGMSAGVTTDDGFLSLLGEEYVITQTSVSVATDGSDRLSLSLVQADLFKETEN
ncbi:minor tail protein [Streptomyces phage Sycamore]|uniref:Minor tail protein n=1 Tax=Streptomyces phage Sycamore TaxID=2767589 RepID=A0A873WNB3_9CAUD|nr:minor tail protein [Streptomyces phage Sycamore]